MEHIITRGLRGDVMHNVALADNFNVSFQNYMQPYVALNHDFEHATYYALYDLFTNDLTGDNHIEDYQRLMGNIIHGVTLASNNDRDNMKNFESLLSRDVLDEMLDESVSVTDERFYKGSNIYKHFTDVSRFVLDKGFHDFISNVKTKNDEISLSSAIEDLTSYALVVNNAKAIYKHLEKKCEQNKALEK